MKAHDLQNSRSQDLTMEEIELLSMVAGEKETATVESKTFWLMALLLQPLTNWGHQVVNWLSSCPCNPKPCSPPKARCPLKGRRSIEMSLGKMNDFAAQLENTFLTEFALQAHADLPHTHLEVASSLLTQWNLRKANMALRLNQFFSSWTERPWCLLRIGECLVHKARGAKAIYNIKVPSILHHL